MRKKITIAIMVVGAIFGGCKITGRISVPFLDSGSVDVQFEQDIPINKDDTTTDYLNMDSSVA